MGTSVPGHRWSTLQVCIKRSAAKRAESGFHLPESRSIRAWTEKMEDSARLAAELSDNAVGRKRPASQQKLRSKRLLFCRTGNPTCTERQHGHHESPRCRNHTAVRSRMGIAIIYITKNLLTPKPSCTSLCRNKSSCGYDLLGAVENEVMKSTLANGTNISRNP